MKGHTIASRLKRRLEIKEGRSRLIIPRKPKKIVPQKPKQTNPQVTGWLEKTDANIDWLYEQVTQSKLPDHALCRVIEQRKSGKKTGLIALARVT